MDSVEHKGYNYKIINRDNNVLLEPFMKNDSIFIPILMPDLAAIEISKENIRNFIKAETVD
jgi:hypothetical protein